MIREFATDFQPPQQAVTGGPVSTPANRTCSSSEIDPLAWVEIEGEAYAPGFFVYNSEVGRRAIGCQTFWFQAVCQNHIVWDATEVTEYTRKHTARVNEGLAEIRAMIEAIVAKRDARKDGFVCVIRKAMETKLGDDAEEAFKEVCKNGIPRSVAKEAVTLAQEKGRFTVWSVVDALTRLAQQSRYAGDRTEAERRRLNSSPSLHKENSHGIDHSFAASAAAAGCRRRPRPGAARSPPPSAAEPQTEKKQPVFTWSHPTGSGRIEIAVWDKTSRPTTANGGLLRHLPAVVPQAGRRLREHRAPSGHGPPGPRPRARSRVRPHQGDAAGRTVLTDIGAALPPPPIVEGVLFNIA